MSEPLTGSPFPVFLAPDVILTAPGVIGSAELRPGADWGGETRGPAVSTSEFLDALVELDFRQSLEVVIDTTRIVEGVGETRTVEGEPAVALTVPAVGDDEAQIALCVDEDGVMTWHLPDGQDDGVGDTRAGGSVTFTIERGSGVAHHGEATGDRGLVSAIGKKLISVLVVPLLERGVGRAAAAVARHYETRNRPQGLLRLTESGWTEPGDAFSGWAPDSVDPVLLFVHGTASSIGSGFASLAGGTLDSGVVLGDALAELRTAYRGQVFAYDHHTLSADLAGNVEQFQGLWPTGTARPVDLVTHSRGGLVARALTAPLCEPGAPLSPRRIVYVATPNGGTALADPGTVRQWIDRMTTMLNLIPDGPWSVVTETMAGVLTVVRVLASGAIGGLPGLAAMDPGGPTVQELPVPADQVEQYAISVDFEPTGRLLHWIRGADLLVDKVFGDLANDVVVPTGGVAAVPDRGLDVPEANRLELGRRSDLWHCSLFTDPSVHDALTRWLRP